MTLKCKVCGGDIKEGQKIAGIGPKDHNFRVLAPEQIKRIEMAVGADGHPEDILYRIRTLVEEHRLIDEREKMVWSDRDKILNTLQRFLDKFPRPEQLKYLKHTSIDIEDVKMLRELVDHYAWEK